MRLDLAAGATGPGGLAEQADALGALWSARQRFVAEVGPSDDAAFAALAAMTSVEERAPWELGPSFEFSGERLVALLGANALDARDPSRASWPLLDQAVAAGAAVLASSEGDVTLPDGTVAILDGGPLSPLDPLDLGGPALASVSVASGRLAPLGIGPPNAALAPDQLAAVAHRGGGARIIAPAGSGKTRVLTERARHLLREWQLPETSMCLVAFNVRAAEEIRSRTTDVAGLHIRTLNSLALAIVNGTGPFLARPDGHRLDTIDEAQVRQVLERLVRFPRRVGTDPAAPWLEALAAVRLGLRDPVEVETAFGGDVDGLADVVPLYRQELANRRALDYDEQICAAIERLLRDPPARAAAQAACRALLVDEFQDLAPAHLLLVRLLSAPFYNCFGVGDDDQTIYGYVGANPDWLVRFDRWFPGSTSHALEVNYRCAPAVVTAATNLLSRNARRVPKTIRPRPGREALPGPGRAASGAGAGGTGAEGTGAEGASGEGASGEGASGEDGRRERAGAEGVGGGLEVVAVDEPVVATVGRVLALLEAGAQPQDIAVLTRVNATLLGVQLLLAERGVPTTAPVSAALLGRSGVRAALAWLALATAPGPLAGSHIGEAARRPPRGISPKLVEWMAEQSSVAGLRRLAGRLSKPADADRVLSFVAELGEVADLATRSSTAEVLVAVRDRVGLGNAMETLDRSRRDVDRSAHGDDLAALVAVAHLQPDPARFGPWLRSKLERPQVDPNGVQLSTVHRVKGREWPYVIVHDASAGLMPHRLAVDTDEERRIFHVALTRSSDTTVVVADARQPSSFLAELDAPGEPATVSAPTPHTASSGAPSGEARRGGNSRQTPATGPVGAPAALVAALKSWRLERARRDGVPPYVVMHDRNLDVLAARRPANLAELAGCPGIGPTKLERYGDEILGVLADAG